MKCLREMIYYFNFILKGKHNKGVKRSMKYIYGFLYSFFVHTTIIFTTYAYYFY